MRDAVRVIALPVVSAMARDPSSLKGWLKTSALALNTDSKDKYKKLIISGKLGEELVESYQYVKSLPAMVPAGITVATREFADVKRLVVANPLGVMFSGTLSQLVVEERALSTIEAAEIATVIQLADTDVRLKFSMGIITVHIEEGEQLRFMPVDQYAEVDALCLLMLWHSGNSQVHSRLIALASDLVFLGRRLR